MQQLVSQKYEYILIRLVKKLRRKVMIVEDVIESMLKKKMHKFLHVYSENPQFRLLIESPEVFQQILIDNEDLTFVMTQIRILNNCVRLLRISFSTVQYEMVFSKFKDLFKSQKSISMMYPNMIYVLCAISRLLSQFVQPWQSEYNEFIVLSNQYKDAAEVLIDRFYLNEQFYHCLCSQHYLQEDELIVLLFKSPEHFQKILNKPSLFMVLDKLWRGNRQFSSFFIEEAYFYQVLFRSHKLIDYSFRHEVDIEQ